MTWFKVDDSFHSHPKVLATESAALGLWVVAGAWSSANLTDGFVPEHVLARLLPDAATLAPKLVAAGLWRKVRGGHQFHDWKQYQPLSSDVRAMREKRAEAGRMGGLASGKTRSKREANASAHASGLLEPPTRPDPPPPKGGGRGGARLASQGAASAPQRARHALDDSIPDWRTMPAVGQMSEEQRQLNRDRAAEARASLGWATSTPPAWSVAPTGGSAVIGVLDDSQDRELTPAWDHPTPPPTRTGRAVGRAQVPANVVPLRPRTA